MTRWNIYLINRGEQPMLYYDLVTESTLFDDIHHAMEKMLDGSDADGFIVTRSDYPVPNVWPGKR